MNKIVFLASISLAVIAHTGCNSFIAPAAKVPDESIIQNENTKKESFPWSEGKRSERYKEAVATFCQKVALNGDIKSQNHLIFGVLASIAALSAVVIGTSIGPKKTDSPNWFEERRGAVISATSALPALAAAVFFSLSRSAGSISSMALLALSSVDKTPEKAFEKCLRARSYTAIGRSIAISETEKNGYSNSDGPKMDELNQKITDLTSSVAKMQKKIDSLNENRQDTSRIVPDGSSGN